jgi:hypothetical protein
VASVAKCPLDFPPKNVQHGTVEEASHTSPPRMLRLQRDGRLLLPGYSAGSRRATLLRRLLAQVGGQERSGAYAMRIVRPLLLLLRLRTDGPGCILDWQWFRGDSRRKGLAGRKADIPASSSAAAREGLLDRSVKLTTKQELGIIMKKLHMVLATLALVAAGAGYSATKAPVPSAKAQDCCTARACCDHCSSPAGCPCCR